jgi:hypothetical protein
MSHVGTSVWQCFSIDFMGDGRIQSAEITIQGSGSRYDDVAKPKQHHGRLLFPHPRDDGLFLLFGRSLISLSFGRDHVSGVPWPYN